MSQIEEVFAAQIARAKLPAPQRELKFHSVRKWRFDFAWPDYMIAVEVEGGTFSGGRHTRGTGFRKDCEKYNAASLDGWTVYRVTSGMITDGTAISTTQSAIEGQYEAI